ncbi:hypothetical protein OG528_10335 [Streptomyces platensis]|uniref:hypothetical protein n=1 Tax=Streptomyces platensis TaxID=58346 RepID=UPI0030E21948
MIRIVTRTRLAALEQGAKRALERMRAVQASADAAYAGHLRTVYDLTADAEAAERAAEADRADAEIAREILERTEALLASARATVIEQAARIDALSGDLDAMAAAVVLLHFGQLHSLHRTARAAELHAQSLGAAEGGWGPPSERPADEVAWRIQSLSFFAVPEAGETG